MMTLLVNGKSQSLDQTISISEFMQTFYNERQNVAIALNNEFVARSNYDNTFLKDNDTLDIVSPVGGG